MSKSEPTFEKTKFTLWVPSDKMPILVDLTIDTCGVCGAEGPVVFEGLGHSVGRCCRPERFAEGWNP